MVENIKSTLLEPLATVLNAAGDESSVASNK
jgi:hypothetical protein